MPISGHQGVPWRGGGCPTGIHEALVWLTGWLVTLEPCLGITRGIRITGGESLRGITPSVELKSPRVNRMGGRATRFSGRNGTHRPNLFGRLALKALPGGTRNQLNPRRRIDHCKNRPAITQLNKQWTRHNSARTNSKFRRHDAAKCARPFAPKSRGRMRHFGKFRAHAHAHTQTDEPEIKEWILFRYEFTLPEPSPGTERPVVKEKDHRRIDS